MIIEDQFINKTNPEGMIFNLTLRGFNCIWMCFYNHAISFGIYALRNLYGKFQHKKSEGLKLLLKLISANIPNPEGMKFTFHFLGLL